MEGTASLVGAALAGALAAAAVVWWAMGRRLKRERAYSAGLIARLHGREAQRAQAAGLLALSEAAYNGLILLNAERAVLHMNGVARALFSHDGPPRLEHGGTLIAVTRNHELDDVVSETLLEREGVDVQLIIRGSTYRVRTLIAGEGEETVIALALEDVSELQRLGRARRDMVANISHELRTPITSIRLLVDTLQRDKAVKSKRGRRLLQKIAVETDTLQQMAQELLDLAMIESGRAEFILKPAELSAIVREAGEQFVEQAERQGLTIEAQVPAGISVLVDGQQIRRVLGNLLHNAIKFTPPGGTIQITAETGGEWVTVAVTDSGPGIPPEERDRVFERFYRSDRARDGSGTGLGLAIAKHIVQAHGGRIWVEQPPTPGARLCFTVPAEDA